MRTPAFALLAAALAGCTPRVEPAGAAIAPPTIAADAVIAADGARLPLKAWLPDSAPNAVILALHGFNDYSNAFDQPAKYWAARGIATYAYDQRGFGAAPNPGIWPGAETLRADLRAALMLIAARHRNTPLLLLGDSMGGAVVMTALADAPAAEVAGAILVAPAVWGRAHMGLVPRAGLWLFSRTLPFVRLTGQGLGITPSDNKAMLQALSSDPLVRKSTRIDAIKGVVDLMDEAFAAAAAFRAPALFLYGEKDEVIPDRPTYDMLARLPADAPARVAIYKSGYHMLLRDLEAEVVLADIAAWIAAPEAKLPSGADADPNLHPSRRVRYGASLARP